MLYGNKPLAEMDKFNKVSIDSAFWVSYWIQFYPYYLHTLLTSPLRVYTPDDADAVFVPMCLGFCHNNTRSPSLLDFTHDTWFFENVTAAGSTLLPHLDTKPHFMVYNGFLRRHWFTPYAGWRETFLKRFVLISMENPGFDNVIAAPHPSHEHFTPASMHLHRWRIGKLGGPDRTPRPTFALAAFKMPLDSDTSKVALLASEVARQCLAHPHLCICFPPTHGANISQHRAYYVLHYNATYNVIPAGNFLILGELYDSIVTMTLPVVLNWRINASAAFTDVLNYDTFAVSLNVDNTSTFDLLDTLSSNVMQSQLRARQWAAYRVRHVFQYMLPPMHHLIRFDDRARLRKLDDAYTFTMKALLRNLCRRQVVGETRCGGDGEGT